MKHSSANTNHENANGADQMPNRADAPLFMMVHQENTPFRANPHGYRLFDYMTSVIQIGLLEPTTVLVRSQESKNLFRMHEQLFEITFIHIPLAYNFLPGISEPVYTFHIGSDLTVARFVKWVYYNEYPEHLDLDSPARTRMPTSRYSRLDEYLLQLARPRVSSLTSAINIVVDREPIPYFEREPIVYSEAQEESITDTYPFVAHLRVYIFATQHGLPLLQVYAFRMAQKCCEDARTLQMRVDRQTLIWNCIKDLSIFVCTEDPMMELIQYILQRFHPQPS